MTSTAKEETRNTPPSQQDTEDESDNHPEQGRRPLRLRAWEIALIFLVGPALIQYPLSNGRITEAAFRIALLASAVRLAQVITSRHIARELETHDTARFRRDVVVSGHNAAILQQRAGRSLFSVEQAKFFALAVTTPSAVRQRVVDTIIPGRRTFDQRVTLEIQAPPELFARTGLSDQRAPDRAVVSTVPAGENAENEPLGSLAPEVLHQSVDPPVVQVPIIIPNKGKLLDNFHLWDAAGSQLSVLSYREYLDLAAGVLRVLLRELEALSKTDCA